MSKEFKKSFFGSNSTLGCLTALTLATITLVTSGCSSLSGSKGDDAATAGLSESELNAQREARFAMGSIPSAEGEGIFRDVGFDYASSNISDSARQNIEYNAQILKQNPAVKVQLEGHCDERGTAEYNMALGAERAKAVQQLLVSFGVPYSRLDTISYGEEVPLETGHNEQAWTKNRRVHFSAYRDATKK